MPQIQRSATATAPLNALENKETSKNYAFPADKTQLFHRLELTVHQFKKESREKPNTSKVVGTITLPIPTELQDSLSVSYNPVELGGVGAEIVRAVRDLGQSAGELNKTGQELITGVKKAVDKVNKSDMVTTGLAAAGGLVTDLMNAAKANPQAAGIASTVAGGLGPIPQAILRDQLSIARNPHKEILFQGLNFRDSFSFSYDLIAKSEEEAKTISKIVNFLRRSALADYSTKIAGNHFFDIPYIIQPKVVNGAIVHPMQFKECVITSVNVNYHPMNYPAYTRGRDGFKSYASNIRLNIRLQEIELFVRSDIPEDKE